MRPKCTNPLPIHNGTIISDNRTMNSEIFSDMMPTTTLIIEKYIRKLIKNKKDETYWFPIDELIKILDGLMSRCISVNDFI
jgi:hypothetical protein